MTHLQLRRQARANAYCLPSTTTTMFAGPSETRTITIEASLSAFHDEDALVAVDGWNVHVTPASSSGVSISPESWMPIPIVGRSPVCPSRPSASAKASTKQQQQERPGNQPRPFAFAAIGHPLLTANSVELFGATHKVSVASLPARSYFSSRRLRQSPPSFPANRPAIAVLREATPSPLRDCSVNP